MNQIDVGQTRKFILTSVEWEGFHRWTDAPPEIEFLRDLHRHIFRADVRIEVTHPDRELEFIKVKRWLEAHVVPLVLEGPETQSCEHMGQTILKEILVKFGWSRQVNVTVWEDRENAGEVEWVPSL